MSTDVIAAALAAGKTALDEWESKGLFAAYGIPVPDGALVTSEAEAIEAAARIGGKVVMKGVASDHPPQDRGRLGGPWSGCGRQSGHRGDLPSA